MKHPERDRDGMYIYVRASIPIKDPDMCTEQQTGIRIWDKERYGYVYCQYSSAEQRERARERFYERTHRLRHNDLWASQNTQYTNLTQFIHITRGAKRVARLYPPLV